MIINGVDNKLCNVCIQYKPSTDQYFYKNKTNSIDGLNPNCKLCCIEKAKQRIKNNYDIFKEYLRKYEKQPRVRKQKTLRNLKYRESEVYKNWKHNNTDKIKNYSAKRYYNKIHDITDIEWIICKEYFNNSCAYCSLLDDNHFKKFKKTWKKVDLFRDHLDHLGSNMIDNCIPACHKCNSSKHDSDLKDWFNESNIYYTIEKFEKIVKWVTDDWRLVDEYTD
ncbi:HNH endonuclease [Paenibacillus polymyxa]|uniref:HNH endonuclease n=1 Tax=Paenibacillus polymyxa TaxID=1406 RepID=UPI00287F62B2|nr:HNH endonuclease [Paenibacillus polymyxa]